MNRPPSSMLHRWVETMVRHPVAANLLMVLILALGMSSARGLSKESFPALPPSSITIDVFYESGSAEAAEEGIAIKIEEAIQNVQGIDRVTSFSTPNNVTVTVKMASGYDLKRLRQDIESRVDSIGTLPARAERPRVTEEERVQHALWLQVQAEDPQTEGAGEWDVMQKVARRLRDRLLAGPSIQRVTLTGERTPEISIELDESRLQAHGLSLAQVANRIADASLIENGGELKSEDGNWVIKADRQRYRLREFSDIVLVDQPDGSRWTLGELATVRDAFDENPVLSRYNGKPSIGLKVEMTDNSDVMTVTSDAREVVEEFRSELPQGLTLSTWYDESVLIRDRLGLLARNSFQGMLLVLVILALFLSPRVAFWAAVGVPVAFAGAFWWMGERFADLSINELTTFGFIMALGIVVDDAVVVGESVHSHQSSSTGDRLQATLKGVNAVLVPSVFGVLTSVVAFLSLMTVEGDMGKIFSQFAFIVAFCLIFSLVESKLILPAHLAHSRGLRSGKPEQASRWSALRSGVTSFLDRFNRQVYVPCLRRLLDHRAATLAVLVSVFILVVGMVPSGVVRFVFFPEIPGDVIRLQLEMEDDTGYGVTHREIKRAEDRLYDTVGEITAAPDDLLRSVQVRSDSPSNASIVAQLSPPSERTVDTGEIVDLWRQKLGAVEGARSVQMFDDWDGPDDLRIELANADPEGLRSAEAELFATLQEFSGVSGVKTSLKDGRRRLELTLTDSGRALGFEVKNLAEQVQQGFQGFEVQRFQRGRDEVKVKVRYPLEDRSHLDDLASARIRTAEGNLVPLSTVAEIQGRYVPQDITRVERRRVAVLTAEVDKAVTSPQEILGVLETEVFPELKGTHPGLGIRLDGEASERAETQASLVRALLLALFAIYALLAIPLASYVRPLVIMTAIPFGVVGAVLGHWIHGLPLSILSLFGLLALCGVVVNDSLLLLSAFQRLVSQGDQSMNALDAIVEAASGRLRAIILTSSTTFVGLMPLLFETSMQAKVLVPAAVSLGYGILFATVVTLILIPVLLAQSLDVKAWFDRWTARKSEWHQTQPLPTADHELGRL